MQLPFKRSQRIFLVIFLLALIVAKLLQYHWPQATIVLKGETLNVLVAQTPAQQHLGLGKRERLAPHDGMLFIFDESLKHTFVMRDMLFPIDIVWFQQGVVVDIAPNLKPESDRDEAHLTRYRPRKEANTVLELPAGWAEAHGLKIGDSLIVEE